MSLASLACEFVEELLLASTRELDSAILTLESVTPQGHAVPGARALLQGERSRRRAAALPEHSPVNLEAYSLARRARS